ncbi:MAG: hypothetical protein WCR46_19345 [Deltaproteobacteria bacterium]|jgi:hypothetical protein
MQLEALYKQGKLEFFTPIKFINQQFHIRVEIPDQEIVRTPGLVSDSVDVFRTYNLSPEALAIAEKIRLETLDLLENFGANDDEMNLTEKQNLYWDAFEFRSRLRQEQCRPA